MFFQKGKHILEICIEIRLDALVKVGESEDDLEVLPVRRTDWGLTTVETYRVFVLPVSAGEDWFFHQRNAAFSHSLSASDILSDNVHPEINMQNFCKRANVDLLEFEQNGNLLVAVGDSVGVDDSLLPRRVLHVSTHHGSDGTPTVVLFRCQR